MPRREPGFLNTQPELEQLEPRLLLDGLPLAPHGLYPAEVLPSPDRVRVTKIEDLDGDGAPEVIGLNLDDTLSVFSFHQDASLASHQIYPVGQGTAAVTFGYLNDDTILDIVTANEDDGTVSVLLGNGDGTFATSVAYGTGNTPELLYLVDLDDDTDQDIVTGDYYDDEVLVLLGYGDGTFASPVAYHTGAYYRAPLVEDLNGDAFSDIVAANMSEDTVSVLLGNGDGTFAERATYETGDWPSPLRIADLNDDLFPDIVIADVDEDAVYVLLNDGDGTFAPRVNYAIGSNPDLLAIGDLNDDSIVDVVVCNDFGITVLLGNGDGTLATPAIYYAGTGYDPSQLSLADLNQDEIPDIVLGGGSTVSVLIGNGNGSFQTLQSVSLDHSFGYLSLADMNGDSPPDLLVCSAPYLGFAPLQQLSVLVNAGDGSFETPQTYEFRGVSFSLALPSDIGGNGRTDVVFWAGLLHNGDLDGQLVLLPGDGDGTLSGLRMFDTTSTITSIALADLDLDGELDVVLGEYGGVIGYGTAEFEISVGIGAGDGLFEQWTPYTWSYDVTNPVGPTVESVWVSAITVGRFDGDEFPDIAALLYFDSYYYEELPPDPEDPPLFTEVESRGIVQVLLGNGDGTFRQGDEFDVGSGCAYPEGMALGYVDSDNNLDLVAVSADNAFEYMSYIGVWCGDGEGSFSQTEYLPISYDLVTDVKIDDLDGDGNSDIVAYRCDWTGSYDILVWSGNGDGTFAYLAQYDVPDSRGMALGDVNEDGETDVVTGDVVLLGNGDGTFADSYEHGGAYGDWIALEDVNGDGIQDLLGGTDRGISVRLGSGEGTFGPEAVFGTNDGYHQFLPVAIGDLNGDATPDLLTDGLVLLKVGAPITPQLPGDANGDGKVDGGDLGIWQQNYDPLGDPANTWGMGDWNGDTKIDGGDLALWQQNYDPLGSGGTGGTQLDVSGTAVEGTSSKDIPSMQEGGDVTALASDAELALPGVRFRGRQRSRLIRPLSSATGLRIPEAGLASKPDGVGVRHGSSGRLRAKPGSDFVDILQLSVLGVGLNA